MAAAVLLDVHLYSTAGGEIAPVVTRRSTAFALLFDALRYRLSSAATLLSCSG
jgi:hypothetical protein